MEVSAIFCCAQSQEYLGSNTSKAELLIFGLNGE